ncbi:hypothetical protein O181_092908 [Austropuccinia psidii MF-1]|uniref:Integrase catalytic domain-containing protein n=1 Tax=Austropuccinia psidii MF-1 TaxID=1389203 RepID=A0A9Q3IZF0_9BASI|nr:hypothetical protein [Austropuccinia psidii MF-1]
MPRDCYSLMTEIPNLPQHCEQTFTFFGTKLSFSTAYHPQTDCLAEYMIQTLEEMVRRLCAYGLELKYFNVLTHYWCALLPALELAYRKSINPINNKTPAIIEIGWNPRIPNIP